MEVLIFNVLLFQMMVDILPVQGINFKRNTFHTSDSDSEDDGIHEFLWSDDARCTDIIKMVSSVTFKLDIIFTSSGPSAITSTSAF